MTPIRIRVFLIIAIVLSVDSIFAQKSVEAFRLQEAIIIDGIHEPQKWIGADLATDFIQMEPNTGEPGSYKSLSYIGFDDKFIYVSALFYQDYEVIAKVQNRDALTKNDDCFMLILDPYNDNRSGYGFWINPLGTQTDFRINDDGRNIDTNWDTEWKSAAVITEEGWAVEIAIPFSSIRYKRDITQWGINFGRVIRKQFETVYWSGALSDDFRISQGGKLDQIIAPDRKGELTIFPYGTLKYGKSSFTGDENGFKPDAGGDIKWKINSNVTADATLNPDFATVEADEEQVNLSRYELRYPEKRLFFQEGNEMYDTRIKTFYSRRIQDILYGAKVNGKAGKYNFNVQNMRSMQNSEVDEPPSFFSTVRVKRDFLESSSVGLTVVDKRNDSSYVTSFSGDYILNLGKTWKLTGQLVSSMPGDFLSHSAWFVRFAKENNIYHVHFRYTEFGENFKANVNETGFIVDDDRREMDSDLSYKWWIENSFLRFIEFTSRNNVFWRKSNGDLRSWNFNQSAEIYLQNRFSFEYLYNNEFKLFEKKYYNHRHNFQLGYNTAEWSHASLAYTFGRNFDRDFYRIQGGGRVKLSKKMAAGYSADYVKFNPDTTNSSTLINVANISYNFTPNLWVEVFAQTRSSTERVYFYGKAGWRFKPPFGAIYLIYSHDQELFYDERLNADIIFLKLTLPISIIK